MFFIFLSVLNAQEREFTGKITDKQTGEGLSYANVIDKISGKGTSSDIKGEFKLKLPRGEHKIVASYIGYTSDTISTPQPGNILNFELAPESIKLSEVTVFPGENPALAIMREAVKRKNIRKEKLNDYTFTAFTKGVVKTDADMSAGDNSVSLGVGIERTDSVKIDGIFENISKGYFSAPDDYREEIVAQKQTENVPSSVNLLTGNRVVQSFYNDDIRFFGRSMVAPLSEDALDYYYFYIQDTVATDNKNVFNIFIEPYDTNDPGFKGNLFISDKDFSLLKVDVQLNEAAMYVNFFEKIKIFQQFTETPAGIYMPADYRLFVNGGFMGLVDFEFEINTIMYDYIINEKIEPDFSEWTMVKVRPGAADADSLYWSTVQTLPYSQGELEAYHRIDSLEAIEYSFWDTFSIFSFGLPVGEHFMMSGPLGLYYFNKIEGNGLNFDFNGFGLANKRLSFNSNISYGFADEKFKYKLTTSFLAGELRTYKIYAGGYNELTSLFEESIAYNRFTSTVLSLFTKYDFRDYYYNKGGYIGIKTPVFNFMDADISYSYEKHENGYVNTDFSFFKRDEDFAANRLINEGETGEAELNLTFDFRRFIEDGFFRRRIGGRSAYIRFGTGVKFADKDITGGDFTYTRYNLSVDGGNKLFRTAEYSFRLKGFYTDGATPMQNMYALPGNINGAGKDNSFRTLGVGDIFGDRGAEFHLNLDLRDELFRMLSVPYLKSSRLDLTLFLNSALMEISSEGQGLIPENPEEFKYPFHEVGFSLAFPSFPLSFEFSWKLNYRGKNNFVFGINTIVF